MVEPGAQLLAYERAQDQGFQELTVRVWWSATLWSAAMVSRYFQQLWYVTHPPMAISLIHPTSYIFMTILAVHLVLLVALLRTPKRLNSGAAWTAAGILALTVAGLIWIALYDTLAHGPDKVIIMEQASGLTIFVIMPLGVWIAWMCSEGRFHRPMGWVTPWRVALLLAFGDALWMVYANSLNEYTLSRFAAPPVRAFADNLLWWVRQVEIAVEIPVAIILGWVILKASGRGQYARLVSVVIVIAVLAEIGRWVSGWIDFGNGTRAKASWEWPLMIFRMAQGLILSFAPMFAAVTWPRVIAAPASADSHRA